jgi:hypothetical protein
MTTQLLIEHLRRDVGLPMGGFGHAFKGSRHVGWTTDEAKATKARDAGAAVEHVARDDPRFSGWEISCAEGQVVGDA